MRILDSRQLYIFHRQKQTTYSFLYCILDVLWPMHSWKFIKIICILDKHLLKYVEFIDLCRNNIHSWIVILIVWKYTTKSWIYLGWILPSTGCRITTIYKYLHPHDSPSCVVCKNKQRDSWSNVRMLTGNWIVHRLLIRSQLCTVITWMTPSSCSSPDTGPTRSSPAFGLTLLEDPWK